MVLQQSNITRVWSVIQPVTVNVRHTLLFIDQHPGPTVHWTDPDPRHVRDLQLHFFIRSSVTPRPSCEKTLCVVTHSVISCVWTADPPHRQTLIG